MSIPLDRLYQYIKSIAEEVYGSSVIIYRFWPHGSKNINDLSMLTQTTRSGVVLNPILYCADQEPLNFDFYQVQEPVVATDAPFSQLVHSLGIVEPDTSKTNVNFRTRTAWNQFEKSILIHSERRSENEIIYQHNGFVTAYYWSHAVIARDWFRYAEHVEQQKQVEKTFLIYNRAWSGTREYRLRFAELLIHLNLQQHCKTSVNPVEPELGLHYEIHKFKNPQWRPNTVLENFFPVSNAHSHYSADFDMGDYENTDIEVVLETLFDDGRLHLTEKSLRPIACGQPFILAATHGSLEYLRSYGFKTFSDIWDESYDLVEDPAERLLQIAELMKQISNWDSGTRENKMAQARAVAGYNRQHFFSEQFTDQVGAELKINLTRAFTELNQGDNGTAWLEWWDYLMSFPQIVEFIKNNDEQSFITMDEYQYVRRLLTQ